MSKFTEKIKTYASPLFQKIGLSSNKPVPSAPQPNVNKRASLSIKPKPKRVISYEINDIKTALTLASNPDTPNRTKLYEIYKYILQDSHLSSQIQVAVQKVLAEPFGIYDGDTLNKEATKLLQTPWFENLLVCILESEFYGFRMIELAIEKDVVELELIPNENVCPEFETIWFNDAWQKPSLQYSEIMDDLGLLFFGSTKELGILHKAAYNVIWKFYARSDWSRASEKFGMPILHIKANTNNDAEIDRLEQKATTFGTDAFIVTQDGDDAVIIERKGEKSHGIYLEHINYCDEQISKLVNGQTGSSDEKAFAGSAQVHERLMEDITFARMRRVRFSINTIVIPFLTKKGVLKTSGEFEYTRFKQKPVVEPVVKPKSKK